MNMNGKLAKIIATAAVTTIAGWALVDNNVKAATTTNQQVTVQQPTQSTTVNNLDLYSNNLSQVQNIQNINFPAGYTLDAVRNINSSEAANAFEQRVAQQGLYDNDYQSDAAAAQEQVDINHLTSSQVEEMNRYGLGLVNKARSEFGQEPFTQDAGTINQVRQMALQYQSKDESLLKGNWHDFSILQGKSENIATFQIYIDDVPGLAARPFAQAKGKDFAVSNAVPLFTVTTMDDLRALVYYGIMGMFFNDAEDTFGHAQNFLTYNQPITTMALYPALTYSPGNGRWGNGQHFTFHLENIDMHYIWVSGRDYNTSNFTNSGTVADYWNSSDQGNYANLDGAYLTSDGQLVATGWHAANATQGHPYRYLIAVDQDGHELGRAKITNVARPDVRRAHDVYNAGQSGFAVKINLSSALADATSIRLISRYSARADDNGDYIDYDFAPLSVNRNNYACLDGATVAGNQLHLTGWHATNQAANKPYHYIIVLNNGREVSRTLVKDGINRADVANVYPNVDGAGKSGFAVDVSLAKLNFNQRLQVISRYSASADGNSNYVDYWFAPLTEGNYSNQGHLDGFKIANGKLNITGWHANAVSQFEQHHFIILYDTTANQQIAAWQVPTVARPDVQRAYPQVATAGQSGFNFSCDLGELTLLPGHRYAVISRYSTAPTGNGNGNGSQFTDYWFASQVLLGNETGYLDHWAVQPATGHYQLNLSGWRATNLIKGYHTLIVYDDTRDQEVTRQTVTDTEKRGDVAQIYGGQYANAGQSGFTATIDLPANLRLSDHYTVIDRYSLTRDANENYIDVMIPLGVLR